MLIAIIFIVITCTGYILSLTKGPIWGLFVYAIVYFNTPDTYINWWAEYIPDLRWSLLSVGILLVSIFIHQDKRSKHKLGFIYFLVLVLLIIIELLHQTIAVSPSQASYYAYNMMGYCIIIFAIVKTLDKFEHFRLFLLLIIVLSAFLGLQGIIEGEFLAGRLDNIGPADANSSNEFGLLLSATIPLILPFIIHGKKYEKVICFLSLPFLIDGFTLTVSRGAISALLAGIIYVYFFIADKRIKKHILIVLICAIPIFFYFADEGYQDRISSLWRADTSTEQAMGILSSGRTTIWKHSLDMVKDYPFGTGPGGFREVSRFYMPEEMLSYHPSFEYGVKAAHNTYLLVLVELGYAGISCFLLLCLLVMYRLSKSYKTLKLLEKNNSFLGLLLIALNMSIVATLFGGLVGSSFYYEFFWWQIAISVVAISFSVSTEQSYIKEQRNK